MGTSFTWEVSSDRLTSCPGDGESHLSAKRHRNRRLAPTLWALWPEKTNKSNVKEDTLLKGQLIVPKLKPHKYAFKQLIDGYALIFFFRQIHSLFVDIHSLLHRNGYDSNIESSRHSLYCDLSSDYLSLSRSFLPPRFCLSVLLLKPLSR